MKKTGAGSLKSIPLSIAVMAVLILLATGIGLVFRHIGFEQTNIVIVYIVSVVLTARVTQGYVYGILCSVISTLTFNFVFTEPYYTLSVNDPAYLVTFAVMTITAIITGALTSQAKQSALDALEKEAETSALYQLTNQLTEAGDLEKIASIASEAISHALRCEAKVFWFAENAHREGNHLGQEDGHTLVWSKDPGDPSQNRGHGSRLWRLVYGMAHSGAGNGTGRGAHPFGNRAERIAKPASCAP